jgi:hypothetical protein
MWIGWLQGIEVEVICTASYPTRKQSTTLTHRSGSMRTHTHAHTYTRDAQTRTYIHTYITKYQIHHTKQIKLTSWCVIIYVTVSKHCICIYHNKACSITPSNGACNNKKIHTHIHTYIHTHTYTHIHSYIHTAGSNMGEYYQIL